MSVEKTWKEMRLDNDLTTIQVTKKLRDQLRMLGSKGETYESIIERLMENYK